MLRVLALFAIGLTAPLAQAHMPWLYLTEEAYPRLFFGESLAGQDYRDPPEAIAAAEVWQDAIDAPAKELSMKSHEDAEQGFLGLEGEDLVEPRGVLRTSVVYGLYHGSKLTYHAQHFPAEDPGMWPTEPATKTGLAATLGVEGEELVATILRDGEPLAGTKVMLSNEEGEGGGEATTDADGKARLLLDALHTGLNGLMVMAVNPTASGEYEGKEYSSETTILTATFYYDPEAGTGIAALPAMPEAIASFGAAVCGDHLYVYSGHIGQAHDHSRDNLSKHFRRIALDGSTDWEELAMGPPLQGMPMVAHGGKLYRVGGLDARNASGKEDDLHSVADFAEYDPATGEWTDLEPMPVSRSSHNAVVVGDKLYVIGGWTLTGDDEGDWDVAPLVYDFTNPDAGWIELQETPFNRRALAVSHVDGKIAALCGMGDGMDLSKEVYLFDPEDGSWIAVAEFPGKAFHGFGLAAWNLDGNLYAGGMEGTLYRLSDDTTEWEKVDEFALKRFFHQLVPDGKGGLLAVGGASPEVGHTGTIERLDLVYVEKPVESETAEGESPALPEDTAEAAAPVPAVEDAAAISPEACPPDRWPGFRGVGTSVTAATDLPLEWSDEKGVAWKADLPGYGQSSPVVWGNRVFVTTMQGDQKETPTVLCFDLETGEELWRREYTSSQTVTASNYVSRSAPTPCVDSENVYAFFESGDLFALTHVGELLWQRSLVDEYGPIEGNHGIGGSPVLAGDRLLVSMLHGGPSYLLAADRRSGETIWKTDFEKRVAWSSPSLAGDRVVVSGSGSVDAYDLDSGDRAWQVDSFDGNNVPSPSVAGDLILIGAQERTSNVAIVSDEDEPEIAWRGDKATSSFASPLIYRGHAYYVSKAGVAHCLDARDGRMLWKDRLPASCWASPVACTDRIYFFTKDGATAVYSADGPARRIAENPLAMQEGDRVYGVAVVASRVLLRTGSTLTCID